MSFKENGSFVVVFFPPFFLWSELFHPPTLYNSQRLNLCHLLVCAWMAVVLMKSGDFKPDLVFSSSFI